MASVEINIFKQWHYDDAIRWMEQAFFLVKQDSKKIIVGCGSHVEHVITFGRNPEHNTLAEGITSLPDHYMIRRLDRGGGASAHMPGQLVLYPVLNLEHHRISTKHLVHLLEQTMLSFLISLGVEGERSSLGPGIYIGKRKVGFIGLRINNNITSHGLAINVQNDSEIYSFIDPCGIKSLLVTSVNAHVEIKDPLSTCMTMLVNSFHDVLLESLPKEL